MSWSRKWSASGHAAPVYSCCSDGDYVYSSSGDRYITRWSHKTGLQDPFAIKLDSPAYVTGVSEKQNILVIGCSNGTVVAIEKTEKKLVWEHNFLGNAFFSFCDCPALGFFLLGDAQGELLVVGYDGKLIAHFPLDCGKIRQIKLVDNAVFLSCQDSSIRRIELPSFNEIQKIRANAGGVNAVIVFPESNMLISGGRDGHLRVLDLVTEVELQAIPAHYQTIYGLEKLDADSFVSVSMDKTIKIWSVNELKVLQRIEFKHGGHNRSVNGCIKLNNEEFATFSDDKSIISWIKS